MIGRTVSHYKITEKLGGGGMGVVYKAHDTKLNRTVALKFLPSELTSDEDAKKRFIVEARAASALDHQNICNIHDIDETQDGQMFICMAHYSGETLNKKIERGPVSLKEAVDIVSEVAEGLAAAHKHGIVHRDIKPANLIVTEEGRVKIVDFGLAKLAGSTRITKNGKVPGTLFYMSPEQARGDEVDARSDIFSLGVVLYELLTGHVPFDGDHDAAVLYGIMNRDPEPMTKYGNDITEGVQQVVDKALQKDVDSRYQDVIDLQKDLKRVIGGASPIPGWVIALLRVMRRYRKPAIPLAVVLIAIIVWRMIPPPLPDQKSLAVLPFKNVGSEEINGALIYGMMYTLTSKLTQLEQFHELLSVIPSSEVYESGITSPREARRGFGVNLIIAGSLQRFGDSYRLTLDLIKVDTRILRVLASEMIDHRITNISAFQDETVVIAANMLNVELVPQAQQILAAGETPVSEALNFYLQGRGYLQRYQEEQNLDHAIGLFERALEHDSLYTLAYAGLGEAYLRKFRDSKDDKWVEYAVENSERAIQLSDSLAPVHVTLGLIYRETGEYERAIREFQRALALDPASNDACLGLGRAYDGLKRFAEAESTYQKAISMKPDYWAGYDALGLFYYGRGRYDDAIVQFGKVVALTPDNSKGYNHLGAAYYAQERWEEAGKMFERTIAIDPKYYRAYSNLAVIYYIQENYAKAASMAKKALELNDTNYRTWLNLANAYYWIPNRRNEAYDIYRHAIKLAEKQVEINPRNSRAVASLAGYYAVIGENAKAMELAEQALAMSPDDMNVMYFTGHTYEQLGEREKALEWIEKALEAGYPQKEIEGDPWLRELRKEERYQQLLQSRRDAD
ncbi:MAG: tetratricopeptide repeat protein [Candidatus Latescibacteria bacterium]|nr:tetratricopeptide repeat protein [Candidatus Latescibacterota bacterium]NIO56761.1 tetratricopeptide repeat protein [Candidatus Latescibacterota bacterium]NIT02346.1 tetratricopeptide repeat protein [Candidatus Latescibacterota bacterium]NIT39229.1 tetratricopeptide repeat protein [Candidatus Latescibacterota bacterium]